MGKELKLQSDIKKSVRADGGYCIKLSNRFSIGIVDLLVALPPFAPCTLEVKDLGECKEGFSRQLDVTPMQGVNLDGITDPYKAYGIELSGLLVGLTLNGVHHLVALPKDTRRLTHDQMVGQRFLGKRRVGNYYDVRPLLEILNIATVAEKR